jgi:hypothetical protein
MNVLNFKIVFSFFLGVSVFSNTHASDSKIAKSAPFEIKLIDTSSSTFSKLRIDTITSIYENSRIVEDTIPPCDIIFYKSGKLEYCKIIETTPETVTYKMCDYQNGPNIVAYKSSIQKIRYANGREEVVVATDKSQKNAYVKPRKDPLAKLAFYFGLGAVAIALVFGVVFLPLVLAGLVLGTISIIKIAKRRHELRGMGLAIIGLILCVLLLLLII